MALRTILVDGDDLLRKTSKPVEHFDARLHDLLDDMAQTMYKARGIGLAAPQVGVLRRVFVVDLGDGTGLREFVNPVISATLGDQVYEEGCLSVPGWYGNVHRPARLTVEAWDRHGRPFRLDVAELMAVCVSHENDHLDGVLFKDKVDGELVKL